MTQHTQEPWYIGAQNDILYIVAGKPPALNNDYPAHDANRNAIARIEQPNGREHAERIVACVNACAGISVERLNYQSIQDYIAQEISTGRTDLIQQIEILNFQHQSVMQLLHRTLNYANNVAKAEGVDFDDDGDIQAIRDYLNQHLGVQKNG